jgi:hypothetical protein
MLHEVPKIYPKKNGIICNILRIPVVTSFKHLKLKIMNEVLMAAVVFFGIYQIFKSFTDFLLRRKIIKAGHFDNAGILDQKIASLSSENQEAKKYPSLKWGLVAFFGGIGFLIIDQMSPVLTNNTGNYWESSHNNFMEHSLLPFGIELVSISLGFIIYFLIVTFMKKK